MNGEWGGVEAKKNDIRLKSATHRDLANMVREETFRQELFCRVNIFPIHLPALRRRPEDIPRLATARGVHLRTL